MQTQSVHCRAWLQTCGMWRAACVCAPSVSLSAHKGTTEGAPVPGSAVSLSHSQAQGITGQYTCSDKRLPVFVLLQNPGCRSPPIRSCHSTSCLT
jgi:hypothetical protein